MTRSRLLGGGKISWKDVMGSKGMELQKWVNFSGKNGKIDGLKLSNLFVEMKVQVTRDVHLNRMKKCCLNKDCDWVGTEIDVFHVETLID